MIFGFQMDPHLQSIKVIPKFLLKSPCAASLSSKTSGYSFLRDNPDYPEIQDNQDAAIEGQVNGSFDIQPINFFAKEFRDILSQSLPGNDQRQIQEVIYADFFLLS